MINIAINVSDAFKAQLENDNRNYIVYADFVLKDGTEVSIDKSNIWENGFSVEDAVSSDNSFDIGAAIVNKLSMTLNNIYDDFNDYDFVDAEITVGVKLELPDGAVETVSKGVFAVESAKGIDIITLSCLDNMRKFDRPYSESKLLYPATVGAIVRDACSVCGAPLNTQTFPHDDFVIQERPDDKAITFRNILQWCAQIAGCFARCNNRGYLELKWYNQSAFESDGNINALHNIHSTYSFEPDMDDIVITGVRVVEKQDSENGQEDVAYQFGQNGYVISIEGNELIRNGTGSAVAGWLGEQLIGFRFRSGSVTHTNDPTIEAGDVMIVTDRKGVSYNMLVSSTKFCVGNNQNTKSNAEPPMRKNSVRYSESTRNYVELRKQLQKEQTAREQAIDNLNTALKNSSGLYATEEVQPDGSVISYFHDKPTIEESKNVIKITAEAIGISNDGGETYPYGMTLTGELITKLLYAVGIDANYINTGAITVKDDDGSIVFSVDVDARKVIIDGGSVQIGGKTAVQAITDAESASKSYSDQKLSEYAGVVTKDINNLQAQLDGQIESFYYDYEPSLSNHPASSWTTAGEQVRHEGDLFYWKSKGYAYRFFRDGETWKWQLVQDTDITKALATAAKAQDTADHKRRVFVAQPTPPYDIGDLWTDGTDILTCSVARAEGSSYVASDWKKLNKYTDDSFAQQVQKNLDSLEIGGRNIASKARIKPSSCSPIIKDYQYTINISADYATGAPPGLYIVSDTLEVGEEYVLSFKLKVTSGTIAKIGGHASAYQLNKLIIDRKTISGVSSWATGATVNWTSGTHTVEVYLKHVENKIDTNKNLYIQPNRSAASPAAYNITVYDIQLEKGNKATDWSPAPEDTESYADNLAADLQEQIDGKIQTYDQTTDPSAAWTDTEIKTQHTGDIWYNPTTKETKRWSGTAWVKLENSEAEEASALAQKKAQVFIGTPTTPYRAGDLWFNSSAADIMTCITARASGNFVSSDWAKRNKYTDDTKANEALEEAKKARALNMILDNEYQGIPTDAKGNYTTFPAVQTGVQVLYGHSDVSADCTYTTAKSTGVTGNWDKTTRIYTVTALTADSGWVDITASYLGLFTVTKRFSFVKQKQGEPGKDGSNGKDGTPGKDGAPGPAGKDGKTSYTHIAYANSADGKTDFSVDNSDRKYVGMYVDFTQADSTDPTKYAWSLIKGNDGTDGIPGKPGADGKTPYFHVAYANSADGKTGFSVSDSSGKLYIGQYTDFSQADSTDPSKYAWTLIKGDTGIPGASANILKGSKTEKYSVDYLASSYIVLAEIKKETEYTFVVCAEFANTAANASLDVYLGQTGLRCSNAFKTKEKHIQVIHFRTPARDLANDQLRLYNYPSESHVSSKVYWCALYEGNVNAPEVWTPSAAEAVGTAARTYFIEPSVNILKRSKNNALSPGSIEFKAYYRDGNSTTRTAYSGRFIIERTADGNTWTRLYNSSADQNTAKLTLTTANVPVSTTQIRCKLYAAGGTTNQMDMQSVPVVLDVDALSHEDIFNLLTNNGAIKGIYKEGNQLYISFSYAKGGTLALGGANNGNGVLQILDANGEQIGVINKDGANFTGPFKSTSVNSWGTEYVKIQDALLSGGLGSTQWGFIDFAAQYADKIKTVVMNVMDRFYLQRNGDNILELTSGGAKINADVTVKDVNAADMTGKNITARKLKADNIAAGRVSITPKALNSPVNIRVSFAKAFEKVPRVVVTPSTGSPAKVEASAASTTVNNTLIYLVRATDLVATGIDWIAIDTDGGAT